MIPPTLRLGSGHPEIAPYLRSDVQHLQRCLNKWGYTVSTDGEFGPITDTAVRVFQRRQGLRDDGIVGSRTWTELLSEQARPTGAGFSYKPPSAPEPAPAAPPPVVGNSGGAPWMAIANQETGQHEVAGKAANPRIVEYHAATELKAKSDEVAWCSSFVNWVLSKAGIAGTRSAAAASWASWGKPCQAKYGAIAVIYNAGAANSSLSRSGNHVGFLVEETSTHFSLLGGNQSDSVKITRFPKKKWRLKAYRWPNLPDM